MEYERRGKDNAPQRIRVPFSDAVPAMKKIKLTGRELAVMRAIDFVNGNKGAEIAERTHIEPGDLVDILNGMCDAGYMETMPYVERVEVADFGAQHFDLNPSYALELKEAMRRY
jgi:hypothetical protein